MKLPIIDFSDLKQETPATWESVKSQVREALEEYGCFEATLHNQIPPHLQKSMFDALQQLFDLPSENKLRNTSDIPYHGHFDYPMLPLYESLGIDEALTPGKTETFTNQMWSQGNPTFSESVQSFSDKLSELDKMVRTMVLESLGLKKYMKEHMDSMNYLVRLMKYDAPQTQETRLGLAAHRDKSIVTTLYQINEVNGLELLTKDGRWITVHPSPNSFIVMVGESFHVWTNGRVHCPYHRVMISGDKERYSVGLFSYPKAGHVIKIPEEMVDEEHPLLFNPNYNYSEYAKFSYSQAGLTAEPLKDYCGVL